MSNLKPGLIPLDKGLNLQTAKIVAPPGSVLDSLNYEQVDFQGQKRIDGFVRYDGSLHSAIDDYYVITLTSPFAGTVSSLVANADGLLGVVVAETGSVIHVAVINENNIPLAGESVFYLDNGVSTAENVVVSVTTGVDSGVTADAHYTNLLAYNAIIRSNVEALPSPIAGLHWFRDRLYAVAGVTAVSLEGTTPIIYPDDTLVLGADTARVLDAYVLGNTRLVFISTMTPDPWQVEGAAVTRNAISVGTVANGFEDFGDIADIASFFESRSEVQVLEEDGPAGPYDFGWRFVHLGWEVRYADGISLYGSLPSLNQNIDGLGVQGPTSVAGANGRPLILLQKVAITNKPVQVNGWKSSQTPTSYQLDPDNLTNIDSTYIYADAYITWDGTTGFVEAPGATDPAIPEYSAAATVEIEL